MSRRDGISLNSQRPPDKKPGSMTWSPSLSPMAVRERGEKLPLLQHMAPETLVTVADELERAQLSKREEAEPNAAQELQTLLTLVYPVVVTTALEFLPGFTCIILAGHINSPLTQQYVDAATLATMFMNITSFSVGFGLTSALDTLCSQAYGAGRLGKIGIYFQSGLVVIAVCLTPIFLVNWYSESFLLAVGQDPEVARMAQNFARWMLPGVPFVFLYELVRKVLQAQNIMKPLVAIAAAGNVVNIVTGYWLTYHTAMGFEGIALSRSLGNMTLPLMLIPFFYQHPQHLTQWWRGWNLDAALAHVGLFLRLGIPGMLMMIMEWWAFELLTLLAGVLPNSLLAVSAHAVLVNVSSMIYMVFSGLAVAANIRVGNCLGANAPKRASLACRVSLQLTLAIAATFSVTLFTFRDDIPSLFLNDTASIARASSVLAVWSPLVMLDGLNAVIQGVFRGAGKQNVAATTNALAYYVGGIPLGALLAFPFGLGLGLTGLWLGFGFGVFLTASSLFFLLFKCWTWADLAHEAQKRTAH